MSFTLPPGGAATVPPEHRGLARDNVRLLVAAGRTVSHLQFRDVIDVVSPGDLIVVNTSGTLPAALDAERRDQAPCTVHVATELDDGSWAVEVRAPGNTGPATDVRPGESISVSGGVRLRVAQSYPVAGVGGSRLWLVKPGTTVGLRRYLAAHGRPIRYGYLTAAASLSELQNVYAGEPGSAEMASAGRPFSERLLVRLVSRGVTVAPLRLDSGVSSPENHEPPTAERYWVPEATADLVNLARNRGRRVVAVGTTVTRALETVATPDGRVLAGSGWTDLVLGPRRPARVVTGLVSGLHDPEASHLMLLEAVAGRDLVERAYAEAVSQHYLWHEFGDSMLFLPDLHES
ncbi:MAG: S-adenosylmethionine:tRNA ribosyltransferase-isomerase [Propionibacteriales bacterium]|nr:S-adenosylmethionine:tRNA ribosyltransferase-isomerase [Propionibacteriales bacterium]